MLNLSDEQIADYLYRSYTAVDGLWFMKVEEKCGFDTALDINDKVWKVMPKIQARMLKSLGSMGDGIEALFECFTTKLTLDRFQFRTEKVRNGFRIIVNRCPWYDFLVKSKRENLAERIASRVCNVEYSGWASEFGGDIHFEKKGEICRGAEACILNFSQRDGG